MLDYRTGLAAGLIATLFLSAIMVIKSALGLMPHVNAIAMLAGLAHARLGLPHTPLTGWILHFIIGTVIWGIAFAWFRCRFQSINAVVAGVLFSIGAWLAMMLVLMPLAGAGLFGLAIGAPAPVATLVLHLIYGATLGWSFQRIAIRLHPAAG